MNTDCEISLLYVEDDPHARTLLTKLLHHKFPALTVYVAADGGEGMVLYKEHRPRLIVTDIAMPVLDGVEMTKRIREIDPDAYVIALTAFNDRDFCVRTQDLRLNHCITKPLEFETLLNGVRDAIEHLCEGKGALS